MAVPSVEMFLRWNSLLLSFSGLLSMASSTVQQQFARKWSPAILLGNHAHQTVNGLQVTVVKRDAKFMARGRFQGTQYCLTLGNNVSDASSELRQLLSDLETDSFIPPGQRSKQRIKSGPAKPISCTDLLDVYLREVRRSRGKKTTQDYQSRLIHVVRFASRPEVSRKWPTVDRIDRNFIQELKTHLQRVEITPNGHPHSKSKFMSQRQIYNVMSAFSTLLQWAQRPDVRRLPVHWVNPVTRVMIGDKPRKDPFRQLPINDDQLIQLINHSDPWQLCTLSLSYLYPLRPGEVAGLLVGDVDFTKKLLHFGTRMGGDDFTKGKQDFMLPFPDDLIPLLQHLVGSRTTGPLLRKRPREHQFLAPQMSSTFADDFHASLREHSEEMYTQQDRKQRFRQFLSAQGGISSDTLTKEFIKVRKQSGMNTAIKLYDLRSLNTSKMNGAKLSHVALRYFTAHSTSDILNTYVAFNPHQEILPYFKLIKPVLDLVTKRLAAFGIKEQL